ncbi:AAA-like domain-containing protein [Acaryochloris thomasi]|nr:AAA-like domain-containing protein [Acaryochloris thomasi]
MDLSAMDRARQSFSGGRLPKIEFPGGAVPLSSSLYIKRSNIEQLAYQELDQPGSLIRIQAPQGMGKRSLLLRLMAYAKVQDYQTVRVNFQTAEQSVYTSLDKFLRWFCANVARQLKQAACLDQYWDPEIGAKLSCTLYFEEYLLEAIESEIVLALSHVEQIFEHPKIAQEFLPMLRFWHEQGKQAEAFQKLRLIVLHATDVYVPLQVHQSPFNVGLPLQLSPFSLKDIQTLAHRHGLDWDQNLARPLMEMVSGHPYLVRLAMYHISQQNMTLAKVLEEAPTQGGIYNQHLRGLLKTLQQQPALAQAFKKVVTSIDSVELETILAHKLNRLGLVLLRGNRCIISCELYRLYFAQQKLGPVDEWRIRLEQLEQENIHLRALVNLDGLTQIANRRSFDDYLDSQWKNLTEIKAPLGLLLLDVDHFKQYNDTYGHPAGDQCLQQVAQVLQRCAKRSSDLVARYGGEEFAVVLPLTNAQTSARLAEEIRIQLGLLEIAHETSSLEAGIVTVSIGVISVVPGSEGSPEKLIQAADKALYRAKKEGRDRIYTHSSSG